MLTESMLQKFTNKLKSLMINQQNEYPNEQENESNSPHDIPEEVYKKIQSDNHKQNEDIESDNIQQEESEVRSIQDVEPADFDNGNEEQEQPKSQKIDMQELSRLIAIEKQKSKQNMIAKNNNTNNTIKPAIQAIKPMVEAKKTIERQAPNQSQKKQTTVGKNSIQMPKVKTMNNLVKLSTKLPCNELLSQIKYQATLLNMTPIRLLLYLCIERILFDIYMANPVDKLSAREKEFAFLDQAIEKAFVNYIGYLTCHERTMISRFLRGVFNRMGIPQYFSEKWLSDCIKKNRKILEKKGVDVAIIENLPTNSNITSNIFRGITSSEYKVVYDYPYLELEDDDDSTERVEDPEIFHVTQKLFFFNRSFNRLQFGQTKPTKQGIRETKNNTKQENNQYQESQFSIKIAKIKEPGINTSKAGRVGTKQKNMDDDEDMVPKRRNRSEVPDSKFQENKYDYSGEISLQMRKSLLELVQEYIFTNIDKLADRICEKWRIDPAQLRQLLNSANPTRSMPTKLCNQNWQKQQNDEQILKQMSSRFIQLQRAGVDRKQVVKQVLHILECKDVSNSKKQEIMNKWIASMKIQKKATKS